MKKITLLSLFTLHLSLLTVFAQTTKPMLMLNTEMHTARINRISTDAAGKYILTASADKTAKLWDATTGDLLKTFRPPIGQGYEGMLFAGALSPNGEIAAVAGWSYFDKKKHDVYIFNTETGELIQRLTGLGNIIFDLEFSPNGTYLAAALAGTEGVVIYKTNLTGLKNLSGLSLVEHKTLTGYSNASTNIAFDNIGRLATVCIDGNIRLYDQYFNLEEKNTGAGKQPYSVAFSPNGKKLAVGYADAPDVEIFSGDNLKLLYKAKLDGMNENAGFGYGLSFSSDGEYLYGGGNYRKKVDGKWRNIIRRWSNAGQGNFVDYIACANTVTDIKSVKTLHATSLLFAGAQPDFGVFDQDGGKLLYKTTDINLYAKEDHSHLKINSSGDEIAFTPLYKDAMQFSVSERNLTGLKDLSGLNSYTDNKAGVSVTDWNDTFFPKINSNNITFLEKNELCRSTDISDDGSRIIFGTIHNIYCTDAKGNQLWKAPGQGEIWAVNISGNGKVVATAQDGGKINWYDMKGGSITKEFHITNITENSIAEKAGLKIGDIVISVDNKKFNSGDEFSSYIKEQKEYIFEIRRNNKIIFVKINKTEDKFGFNKTEGQENRLLLTLYVHHDNKYWLLYTPDGYFDCSPGAEELAGWHVNQGADKAAKFYPLSQFYDQYYTPNLGARVLAGEEITSDVKMSDFKLPPLVEITYPEDKAKVNKKDLTVNVKVTDQGGGIDEIRLYLNGKLIETTQRGFVKVEQNGSEKTKTFTITLANGENKIKATAYNKQRTESLADEITVFYEGTKKTANLYMLVIGIDNYKNPRYKLNYALADATSFKDEVEKGSKDIFGSVNITFLKDAQATKTGIIQEFDKLKSTVLQEDVFIFYYAGHGVMSEEDKAQYYIVPQDVTQLYGNNEMLQSKAISANELQTFSTELKAQKQMFVLDACQSGGMVEMLAMRGAAEEKAVAQLARSTGTFWLTASGSEQFATEFAELGHGVFTYAIIQGLKGEADGGSKDKKITVKELSAFLNDKVPELSEKYKGSAQYPTSYGYGQDFPIIIVK